MVPAIAEMPVLAPKVGLASVKALVSLMETLAPVEFKLTAPVKSLVGVLRVISPAPALKVTAPVPEAWVIAPLWVMPTAVTVSVPVPRAEVPKSIAELSVMETLKAPELFKLTEPVKSLLFVRVITPVLASKVTAPAPPAWVMTPLLCVMPTAFTVSVLAPRVDAPKIIALTSLMETVKAPELFKLTAPVKSLLGLVRVITPAPALKVAAPALEAWMMAPLCVMPTAVTVKVPLPKLDKPKAIALTSVMETVKAPELFKLTVPVKLLLELARVIAAPPALISEVPVIASAPV